ncbi:class I SAM-dependent methyltransferase [Psychrobacter sp. I-STPA10]|uniref:class I SAM-dependent methyltransferase n=1 Tax=Psychrobacter sp. I-STPA10 TaxID=2585769 RepID=UPI001E56D01F|nr:class I SAM-dependent methyltransferase [Psychrobacter sp. I-STPA10]
MNHNNDMVSQPVQSEQLAAKLDQTTSSDNQTQQSSQLSHNENVNKQFGERANAYLSSAVHAKGRELQLMAQKVAQINAATVLDLGCGAGHASFAVAPHAKSVVAYDLSGEMLTVVEQAAADKQLTNISTSQGVVEKLPFADNSFDVVVSRFSAHHWQDVLVALQEAKRVLTADGLFIMVDVIAPSNPAADSFLQTIELLRDTSHVRDYSLAEWQSFLSLTGFRVNEMHTQRLPLDFATWIARMRTPKHFAVAITELIKTSSQEVKTYFDIQADGSFSSDMLVLSAQPNHLSGSI